MTSAENRADDARRKAAFEAFTRRHLHVTGNDSHFVTAQEVSSLAIPRYSEDFGQSNPGKGTVAKLFQQWVKLKPQVAQLTVVKDTTWCFVVSGLTILQHGQHQQQQGQHQQSQQQGQQQQQQQQQGQHRVARVLDLS